MATFFKRDCGEIYRIAHAHPFGCFVDDPLPLVQVLDINAVIYGLIYLFYEPNPEDPLNHEAAELYRENISQFERTVKRTLAGCMMQGEIFQRLI